MSKVICLLSGGIDSAVAAAIAREQGDEVIALTVEYGQPTIEKKCAILIAEWLKIEKPLFRVMPSFNPMPGPANYFPARNMIFLSFALQQALIWGADRIVIGANRDDYVDYPDCRPEFFLEVEKGFRMLHRHLALWTPLVAWTKTQVVGEALRLGVPLAKTSSCYRPRAQTPCGVCNACLLRKKAFEANGIEFECEPINTSSLSKGAWPENWNEFE